LRRRQPCRIVSLVNDDSRNSVKMKLVSLSMEPLKSQRREGAGSPSTEKGMHQWCCLTAAPKCTMAGTMGRKSNSKSQGTAEGEQGQK
jgi:hypothetical protein